MASTNKRIAVPVGTTGLIVDLAFEASNLTTGVGKTGLAYNSTSLACYQSINHAAPAAMSLVTATQGTWTSLGFVEKDATNMPGLYELGVPNASLAAVGIVEIILKGVTNVSDCRLTIEVYNPIAINAASLRPY